MEICPREENIRRKEIEKGDFRGTDRLELNPTYDSIASIKNIIVNFDESVSIRFLVFHTTNNAYCKNYKINKPDEKICDICDKGKMQYVHFYFKFSFEINRNDVIEYKYLVAFLPFSANCSELSTLTNELYQMAKKLKIKKAYCKVFRFESKSSPKHSGMDTFNWQKELNNAIENELFKPYIIEDKIDNIERSLKEKNITISKNITNPLQQIKVS
jgi:hypothetical protein